MSNGHGYALPILAGSSLQGGKTGVPGQVPSVLLLAHRSLDGATDLNIPNMRKDGLNPDPGLTALAQAK